jgi:hypothetical protein
MVETRSIPMKARGAVSFTLGAESLYFDLATKTDPQTKVRT